MKNYLSRSVQCHSLPTSAGTTLLSPSRQRSSTKIQFDQSERYLTPRRRQSIGSTMRCSTSERHWTGYTQRVKAKHPPLYFERFCVKTEDMWTQWNCEMWLRR